MPVWGVTLSRPLRIIGLVGHYPTNYLIRRGPILKRYPKVLYSTKRMIEHMRY